jgi:hypothetical protein
MVCDFHQNTCALFSFLEAAQGLSHTVVKDSFVDKQYYVDTDEDELYSMNLLNDMKKGDLIVLD